MYLNSKSYEKKYKKYKNKYKEFKKYLGGIDTQGTLLNGGECVPLPGPEEDDFAANNLLDLCPDERITIQNKCYNVRDLHKWMINPNKDRLPDTQSLITHEEIQKLIQAYEILTIIPNKLTRDKLIQIFPNLQQEGIDLTNRIYTIDLSNRNYTDITLGTFNNLPIQGLYLENNQIRILQPGIFDNLLNLGTLYLQNNKIRILEPGIFDNLPNLRCLYLNNNLIQKLQPGIFNNLPRLTSILNLDHNQIRELQPGTFDNLSRLEYLSLDSNQIQELQPGIFNNLHSLEDLSLNSNQIREIHYGVFNNGLSKLIRLYLNYNGINVLKNDVFIGLPNLRSLYFRSNHIRELLPPKKQWVYDKYGLSDNVQVRK